MKRPSMRLPDGHVFAEGLAGAVIGAIAANAGGKRQPRFGVRSRRRAASAMRSSPAAEARTSSPISPFPDLIPFFGGKAVLVDFDQSVSGQAPFVMPGLFGLIGRLDRRQAAETELVESIRSLVAQHRLSARFVAQTREAMWFRVMPIEPDDVDPDSPMWV